MVRAKRIVLRGRKTTPGREPVLEAAGAPAGGSVIIEVTPQLSESGSTIYTEMGNIRAPASILIWFGSPARTFQISGVFLSRTPEEASKSFKYKNRLASWRLPETSSGGVGLESYPATVYLNGYGDTFKNIPTLVQSVSFDYNEDSDLMPTSKGEALMPIILPFSVTLKEAQAIQSASFNEFNIKDFRNGRLPGW